MTTFIHQQVERARSGELPELVARLPSGWVVLGNPQIMRGYCLLLPDPVVPDLNALGADERTRFLADMVAVGDALLELVGATRINYEILGNLEPALHAHVIPRHTDEPEPLRTRPIWFHDWQSAPPFSPDLHGELQRALAERLGPHRKHE